MVFTGKTLGYRDGHFIYSAERKGKCSLCGSSFEKGEPIRVPGDLDDNGWWHDACPTN